MVFFGVAIIVSSEVFGSRFSAFSGKPLYIVSERKLGFFVQIKEDDQALR